MASPLCDACDDEHAATHICTACAAGERLLCDKVAETHKSGKKTKDHPLLVFKDAMCQICDDPHAATHFCVDCNKDEWFICQVRADTHKSGKKTKTHTLFILPERNSASAAASLMAIATSANNNNSLAPAAAASAAPEPPSDDSAANHLSSVSVGPNTTVAAPREASAQSYVCLFVCCVFIFFKDRVATFF
jgi:hypothetical protein